MTEIDIQDCLWDKASNTLVLKRSKLPSHIPQQIGIIGKKYNIQFFWDEEQRYYKFDKIVNVKSGYYDYKEEQKVKSIVIIVDVNS
jgi:hypothetical protein